MLMWHEISVQGREAKNLIHEASKMMIDRDYMGRDWVYSKKITTSKYTQETLNTQNDRQCIFFDDMIGCQIIFNAHIN